MASQIIGRTDCPECKFGAAHVKKSEKCHYRYCPECAAQYHARTPRQVADLLAKMRPEKRPQPAATALPAGAVLVAVETVQTPEPIKATPATKPPPKTAPQRRGAFDI